MYYLVTITVANRDDDIDGPRGITSMQVTREVRAMSWAAAVEQATGIDLAALAGSSRARITAIEARQS